MKTVSRPSAAADRVTFMRRIYLDMHGLPPTQRQVQAFVKDRSDEAYRRVIDQVLDGAHYGERWARHWLDVVRFGESTGFEVNRDRANAWYYRDYVIRPLATLPKQWLTSIVVIVCGPSVT